MYVCKTISRRFFALSLKEIKIIIILYFISRKCCKANIEIQDLVPYFPSLLKYEKEILL